MTWLRQTLDHLFTEPSERSNAPTGLDAEAAAAYDAEARRRRQAAIRIEAHRGPLSF